MNIRARLHGIFRCRQPDPAVVLAAAIEELARTYVPGGYATIQVVADRTGVEVSGCSDGQCLPLLATAMLQEMRANRTRLMRHNASMVVAGQGRWV